MGTKCESDEMQSTPRMLRLFTFTSCESPVDRSQDTVDGAAQRSAHINRKKIASQHENRVLYLHI